MIDPKRHRFLFVAGLACLFTAAPRAAHAYIDPGTGAMILQLLLGGIAGAFVVLKLYWQKLKDLIRPSPQVASERSASDRDEQAGGG